MRRLEAFSRICQEGQRNTVYGGPVLVDCENVTVYNEPGADEMAVCVVGMQDVIVVTTQDGVLVCSKGESQRVRKGVQALKGRGASQL